MEITNKLKTMHVWCERILTTQFVPYAIFFLISLVVFTWFNGYNFISGGDFTWALTFGRFYESTSHVWDSSVATGYNNPRQLIYFPTYALPGYLFESAGINSSLFEQLYFFINFFAAGCGIFVLLRVYAFSKRASLIASLLYLFNPYTLAVVWVPKHGNNISIYCFLPLAIYTAILFLRTKKIKFLFYHLIVNLFFIATFVNPAFFLPYAMILLLFISFEYILTPGTSSLHVILLIVLNVVAFSYWALPFSISLDESFASASNSKLNQYTDSDLLQLNSVKIIDALRADGFWPIQAGENGEYYYKWHDIFLSPVYIYLSFFLVSVALLPLLAQRSHKKKMLIILIGFFVFAVLLNNAYKNDAPLLVKINKIVFENDFLARALRNIYAKLGVLLILPLSILIAFFIDLIDLQKNNWYRLLIIPIILYIIILSIPFFNGSIVRDHGDSLPGDKFNLPNDYYSLIYDDSFQKEDYRYFEFPLPKTYNYRFIWNETNKYTGAGFLRSIVNKPVVYVNTNEVVSTVPCITNTLVLYHFLSLLNIDRILIHHDVDSRVPSNYICFDNLNFINQSVSKFNKKDKFEYFSIYLIPSDFKLSRIYTPNNIILTDSYDTFQDILASTDYALSSAIYQKSVDSYHVLTSLSSLRTTELTNSSEIYIPNNSFEEGLWTQTPDDCTNTNPGFPNFTMNLSDDATNGNHSLELGSNNHNACTNIRFAVNLSANKRYILSFDYKNLVGNKMQYGLILNNANRSYTYSDLIKVTTSNWTHYEKVFSSGEDINNIQLSFYAPSENNNLVKNRFDNIRIFSIEYALKKISDGESHSPVLEFKRINPSKYRIRIHNASNNFPIVFSESYHEGWKIYSNDLWQDKPRLDLLSGYKIIEGNQVEQASAAEVLQFIQDGIVSTIGDGSEKTSEHKLMENNAEKIKYYEKYNIDFISKNVQGSIQNDNLPEGAFYETWLGAPLTEDSHLMANGYANSWVIEPKKICSEANKCKVTPDGTYDFELVVEFWPERLFQIGLFISISSLFACLAFSIYEWRYDKGDKWARKIHDRALKHRIIQIITK